MRTRGQTVELRAADLRFIEPEADQFLNNVMGLYLDAGSVAALAERTEGWIAGLQMAALSMRDREDVSGFIAGFSGTNRYILDYLIEEVLALAEYYDGRLRTGSPDTRPAGQGGLCQGDASREDLYRLTLGRNHLAQGRYAEAEEILSGGRL